MRNSGVAKCARRILAVSPNRPEPQIDKPRYPAAPESKLPAPESKLGMASSTSTLLVDPEGKLRIVSTATAGKELKQRFGLRPAYVIKLLMPLHKRKTVNE